MEAPGIHTYIEPYDGQSDCEEGQSTMQSTELHSSCARSSPKPNCERMGMPAAPAKARPACSFVTRRCVVCAVPAVGGPSK